MADLPPIPKSYADLGYEQIRVDNHPAAAPGVTSVVVLQLYRPKNYNAFTVRMMQELEEVYNILSRDDRVKCIVVTGSGKMFCAGADLQAGFDHDGEGSGERGHRDGGGRVALAAARCRKPTIAAINGAAVGVGITMTLPMTIRIAYRKAKVGFVFARRGLVSEAASSFYLPRLVGYGRATHITSTGAVYQADDQLCSGLFTEYCDAPETTVTRALEIAEDIANNTSAVSAFLTRELIWRGKDNPDETHLLDSRILANLRGGKDNNEGVQSFMEKRPANFTASVDTDLPDLYPWWPTVDTKAPGQVLGTGRSSKL